MTPSIRPVVLAVVCFVGMAGIHAAGPCDGCVSARFWVIPTNDHELPGGGQAETGPFFPELARLRVLRERDVGIAFSGGGARSASAAVGQLRGLEANGWLTHVRYMSAVSGGSWTAVPFTFAKEPVADLLGHMSPPEALQWEALKSPNGQIARAILNSAVPVLRSVVGLHGQTAKAYTRLIGRKFIDPLVEPRIGGASERPFFWDSSSVAELSQLNRGTVPTNVVLTAPDRPFLVVGGTVVSTRGDYVYPLLMPVEYTPLYIGIRQHFGRYGGTLVWPWAYHAERIVSIDASRSTSNHSEGTMTVYRRPSDAITLADVAASSGAAPELTMIRGELPEQWRSVINLRPEELQTHANVFPSFRRIEIGADGAGIVTGSLPHADGGALDNLGLMPLLARQVTNILVFVNTPTPYVEANEDIRSFFVGGGPPNSEGAKTHNVAFPSERYNEVIGGLAKQRSEGEPQVYCGRQWAVLPNEYYNVRGYDGLNICWFYNASAVRWQEGLTGLPAVLPGHAGAQVPRRFKSFPWYPTLELNLNARQINLLAHLWAWIVTDPATVSRVRDAMPILPPVPSEAPPQTVRRHDRRRCDRPTDDRPCGDQFDLSHRRH